MSKGKVLGVILIILLIVFIVFTRKGLFGKGDVAEEQNRYTATFIDIFDTRTEIVGYAPTEDEFSKKATALREELINYNNLYDIYNDYEGVNNIKTINDNAGVQPVVVDEKIIDLLKFSKEMYAATDGRVNIAMGSVLSIWHRYREAGVDDPENAKLPPIEDLKAAAEHTDIENLIIDETAKTVYLQDPEMSLDVGSTAKGYAAQKTMEFARAQGYSNMLLSLGGNIAGIDGRIDGTPFRLGIQNPDMDSDVDYIKKVDIKDGQCVVSSGDYQRYYEVDGKRYCHIINPDTLFPSDTFAQVSIITDDSGMADAFSTALYNMTIEDGLEFVNTNDNIEAMWVYADGSIVYSDNFEQYLVD
ncbi:MAG: FAD:protein FMN transferase [Pseudobutyrivibrio sp.]|nr:FAD:protein FMN transferase [Pseudobutyrivibrio sp.]